MSDIIAKIKQFNKQYNGAVLKVVLCRNQLLNMTITNQEYIATQPDNIMMIQLIDEEHREYLYTRETIRALITSPDLLENEIIFAEKRNCIEEFYPDKSRYVDKCLHHLKDKLIHYITNCNWVDFEFKCVNANLIDMSSRISSCGIPNKLSYIQIFVCLSSSSGEDIIKAVQIFEN